MSKYVVIIIAIIFVLAVAFLFNSNNEVDNMADESHVVKQGDMVSVQYTGRFESGEVFDTSVGKQPLTFSAGAGQMIAGFDKAVMGMAVGDKKTVTLPPEEAYGPAGSGHQLAGKTLIFDIELLEIKG